MFSPNKPNCKALHECILYYFREHEGDSQTLIPNVNLRFIIITDFTQFYIFSAREFERHFYKNKAISNLYKTHKEKGLIDNSKDFYTEIQKILVKQLNGGGAEENLVEDSTLRYTAFDLRNDKHLNIAHKILNRDFLHHEYKQDPNALNPRFYKELLHILGLKEFDRGGKITIELDDTQSVSFAKHIASKLESHNEPSDFEAVISHILLWLNRILFLKLIEANLLAFNGFDKSLNFLSSAKITSFKHLSHLFFEVLARDYEARGNDKGFNFLPYLNSSLFIKDERLETLDIALLDDALEITIFQSTQSTHKAGSKCAFLTYLFDFLNAFDFGKKREDSKAPCHSEALAEESQNVESSAESHDIESSDSKDLIRSSVLGAVFEKLNGYKEGSFYTPSFITSYMCKESLAKIVVEKFNAAFAWSAQSIEDLRKHIDRDFGRVESQAKQILSSMRICDPAVGSGHFLVSALNEMIFIYHKLGLLGFGYQDLQIKDDEIHLITKEGETFAYKRLQDSNHTIQIALFTLKKSIIENNLFGVDINPNSCNIARLRLWIELLKNAYYLNFTKDKDSKIHKLQTLPNIDINIKCGNSLISNIDTNITLDNFTHKLESRLTKAIEKRDLFLHQSLMSQIQDTKKKAQSKFQEMSQNARKYKNEHDKQSAQIHKMGYEEAYHFLCALFKRNCDEYINFHQALKEFFYQYGYINLAQLEPETRFHIESYADSFDFHKSVNFERSAQREIPQKELENILKLMRIYEEFQNQATFEWRFAFPEVLDLETFEEKQKRISANNATQSKENKQGIKDTFGDFLGFDLVIGNPPYVVKTKSQYPQYKWNTDLYMMFFEKCLTLTKQNGNGYLNFITPRFWLVNANCENMRKYFLNSIHLISLSETNPFEKAVTENIIAELQVCKPKSNFINHHKETHEIFSFVDTICKDNFKHNLKNEIVLNIDKNTLLIFDKICKNTIFLEKISKSKRGAEYGKKFCEQFSQGIKVLLGYDVSPYCIKWNNTYIDEELKDIKRLKPFFDNNLIYLRRVDNRLSASIGFEKFAFIKNIYGISITDKKYSPLLILALLNSRLLNFYYLKKFTTKKEQVFPEIQTYLYEKLPIPKINAKNQNIANQIIALVDEILMLKAKDSTFDTAALESQIDCLVYKLYHLTQAEIQIIESK